MALSEARKRANAKYNAKAYDRLELKVLKGNKEIIQNYCKEKNTSVNSLMNNLLNERLAKDGYKLIIRENENIKPETKPLITTDVLKDDDEPLIMPWEEEEE